MRFFEKKVAGQERIVNRNIPGEIRVENAEICGEHTP
jgi:hypothetical protein